MTYSLYLKLDQKVLSYGDYSTENKITGTIYTNKGLTTAKNLTGYTLTLKFYKRWRRSDNFSKTATIESAANGTWSYALSEGDLPQPGLYLAKVELTKSGVKESTLNTVEMWVKN